MLELLGTVAILKLVGDALEARNATLLAQLCIGVVVVFVAKYFFTFGQVYYLSKAAQRLTADLRTDLFRKLHELPVAYFNEKQVGELQSVLTNDVTVIQSGVPMVREVVDAPVKVVLGLASLFFLSWQLALISLIALPPVAWLIQYNARKVKNAQVEVQEDLSDLQTVMQESLSSVRIVKAFNAEAREVSRFADRVERAFASGIRLVRRIAVLKPRVELVGAVALAGVCWIGGVLVIDGALTIPALLAFGFALDKIVNGAKGMGQISQVYSQVAAATERVYRQVFEIQPDIRNQLDARTLDAPRGRIEYRNVSFTYPDGTKALDSVSFVVEPGTVTALVGRSGAGKSTVADLLLRFYDPTEGAILFDGVDIRELDVNWYRRQIGVVPQQTVLFATTLRENVAFGNDSATDEQIKRAMCMAHADEFVERLPEGANTLLGEKGTRLSGGEMQRIAIARALLVDPVILLLDEATSSLDAMSERRVQEALDEVMHGRTTLMIAHRLSTAARADQILVFSHGAVIERGTHATLQKSNGAYAAMYQAFNAGLLDETID